MQPTGRPDPDSPTPWRRRPTTEGRRECLALLPLSRSAGARLPCGRAAPPAMRRGRTGLGRGSGGASCGYGGQSCWRSRTPRVRLGGHLHGIRRQHRPYRSDPATWGIDTEWDGKPSGRRGKRLTRRGMGQRRRVRRCSIGLPWLTLYRPGWSERLEGGEWDLVARCVSRATRAGLGCRLLQSPVIETGTNVVRMEE